MYKGGQLSGAVYPGIGQEASMAGIAAGMADTDIFGGTHRDLGVQIKKGVTLKEIALNFLENMMDHLKVETVIVILEL